jgi:hypothetical protein
VPDPRPQGFPTITVPAGFTTEVYDRARSVRAEDRRRRARHEARQAPRKLLVDRFLAAIRGAVLLKRVGVRGRDALRTPPEGYGDVVPTLEAPPEPGG